MGAINPDHFTHFYVDDFNSLHGKILPASKIRDINKRYNSDEITICVKHPIPAVPVDYPIDIVYQSQIKKSKPKPQSYVIMDDSFHVAGNPKIITSRTYNQKYTTTSTVSKNIQLCMFPDTPN